MSLAGMGFDSKEFCPSCCLAGASLPLDLGYLLKVFQHQAAAAPALPSWISSMCSQPQELTLEEGATVSILTSWLLVLPSNARDFPVVQWLRCHAPNAGGSGLIPVQGTRSHMPKLRVCMLQLKILCAATDHS